MGHEVFISHAATDKAVADGITNHLERGGVKCWVAPRDIRPGDTWGGSIVKAIESCSIMVILFSGNSNRSQQVLREVERAIQKNVVVLPFRIEEIEPTGDMEYFLSATHWLDAISGDLEFHYNHLLSTTRSILGLDDSGITSTPASDSIEEKPVKKEPLQKQASQAFNEPAEKELVRKSSNTSNTTTPAARTQTTVDASLHESTPAKNHELEQNNLDKKKLNTSAELNDLTSRPAVLNDQIKSEKDALKPQQERRHAPDLVIERSSKHNPTTAKPGSKLKFAVAACILAIGGVAGWLFLSGDLNLSKTQKTPLVKDAPKTTESVSSNASLKGNNESNDTSTKIEQAVTETTQPTKEASLTRTDSNLKVDSTELPEIAKDAIEQANIDTANDQVALTQSKIASTQDLEKIAQEEAAQEEAERLAREEAEKQAARRNLINRAENGDIAAQLQLANMYRNGKGVSKNLTKSATWFRRAADANNAQAQYEFSTLLFANSNLAVNGDSAIEWLTRAAENNNADAVAEMADRYSNGTGVEQDDQLAFNWYRRASELGSVDAQKNLATLYEFGIGTEKNLRSALQWYKAAADQGDMSSKLYVEKLLEKSPNLLTEAPLESSAVQSTQNTINTESPDKALSPQSLSQPGTELLGLEPQNSTPDDLIEQNLSSPNLSDQNLESQSLELQDLELQDLDSQDLGRQKADQESLDAPSG